jgi:glycosyltransferase involved in cell wall biosynthesis
LARCSNPLSQLELAKLKVQELPQTHKTLIFVANAPGFFLSHRLPIALEAQKQGFNVHVATPDGPQVETIALLGLKHHVIPFNRKGQNPFHELKTLVLLFMLFRNVKPDLVHLVTVKPILYGGLAARIAGIKAVVAAVSGMGTIFISNTLFARIRRWFILIFYKQALKQKRLMVIFQNHSDKNLLLSHHIISPKHVIVIRGSGVDLADYPAMPEPKLPAIVVMASRLLKDKGVFEFANAAKLLKSRKVNVEMRLIGDLDDGNQSSLSALDLDKLKRENNIKVLGYSNDIAQQYSEAHIVCLPSYREGLPKALIEAAACGRAVVTTDTPGCRDAIIPDQTGLLVPVKNSELLAGAIQKLIENNRLRLKMGKSGRALAEKEFAISKIVDQHLDIFRSVD